MNLDTCFATLTDGRLRIGNALMQREWRVTPEGLLQPVSLVDRAHATGWLKANEETPPVYPEGLLPDEPRKVGLRIFRGKRSVTETESLVATLTATGKESAMETVFQVFPNLPGISSQLTCRGDTSTDRSGSDPSEGHPTGIETAAVESETSIRTDLVDFLFLSPRHLRLTAVTLRDQTDQNDELVHEEEMLLHPNKNRRDFEGILFSVEDTLTGNGLILVKEAPLPHACPVQVGPTLQIEGHTCTVRGHGSGGDGLPGYRFTILAYSDGAMGRTSVMHRWQRALREYRPGRDGLVLTNTWGDRSQDSRISESFMNLEVEAAAELSADVVQIDDGWQHGRTANSIETSGVWEGFREADPAFWEVRPDRFPQGLQPLMQRARDLGMQFGLWFAPDSADEFGNWKQDAECILAFHRSLGVRYIKIDGVKAVTKKGERNLRRFFDRVLEESGGEIVFDLDVTAGIRPGYFGMINVGPIFVENRYTDWFNYWPHRTLRNFWQLARWIDPVRLRMEFLNNARNTDRYEDDPLAPAAWSPACLFASVLFSSPLGWFEVSGLEDTYVAQVAELAKIRRSHRDALLSGPIQPIGSVPDGVAWTGFLSGNNDDTDAYALVFRELSPRAEWVLGLDGIVDQGNLRATVLAGKGTVRPTTEGLRFNIPEQLGFLLVQLTTHQPGGSAYS